MEFCLQVDPPLIIPWLSEDERARNVILIDFEADLEDAETARLDVNIVFDPIPVRRGFVTRADYYIGSTAAEIAVHVTGGKVVEHTGDAMISVNYTNAVKVKRQSSLSLIPSIKSKTGKEEVEASLGSLTRSRDDERNFTASFTSSERILSVRFLGDEVKWSIALPRGAKVVRDFLDGNLYLLARCRWSQSPQAGRISVRPADVLFFDADRKPIGKLGSLIMQYVLRRRGIRVDHLNGFTIRFQEIGE